MEQLQDRWSGILMNYIGGTMGLGGLCEVLTAYLDLSQTCEKICECSMGCAPSHP